jgi:hypothetical protein
MAFWANDPGTLPRVPGPDESARSDDLNVYLDWSPVEDADWNGRQAKAPKARALFLGQLPDDQPDDQSDDGWSDDLPDSEPFEPDATFETELVEPVEIPAGEGEQSWAPVVDEPIGDATAPVAPVVTAAVPRIGGREARRAVRNRRARVRRSLVVAVAGVVAALVAGTAVYVGTRASGRDQRARRPPSTSLERQSSSTTGTTAGASDGAPATEPAPVSDPATGSAAPASSPGVPRGTSPTQTGAGATGGGPAATSQPAPDSTGAPPNSGSPPSAPPRSPTCQLLPVVCP